MNNNINNLEGEDDSYLDYQSRFTQIYDESYYSSGLSSWAMNNSHKLLEKNLNQDKVYNSIIEIGAGTGEHVKHVTHKYSQYILSDHDSNALRFAEEKLKNYEYSSRLKYKCMEGNHISFESNTFDRLIATHTLEHITNPHLTLKEWARVTKHNGIISIIIPTDPGLLWRISRNLGPRQSAIKKGLAYDYIIAREHVNSCANLISLLRYYFPDSKESWWPLNQLPFLDVNLFFAFHAKVTKY